MRARRRAQASAEVLTKCTKLIGKSRLWSGKAEVVKAVSKIASKWSIVGGTSDATDWSIFGAGNAEACEWIPIQQTQNSQDWDSLFLEDGWFKSNDAASVSSQLEENKGAVTTGGEGDGSMADGNKGEEEGELDFDDEEKIVGSEQLLAGTSDVSEDEDGVVPSAIKQAPLTVVGICRLLLEQGLSPPSASSRDNDILLPYRAASLGALADILNSLHPGKGQSTASSNHDRYLYRHIAPALLSTIRMKETTDEKEKGKPQPPLITARCLGCLSALLYHGIGSGTVVTSGENEEDIISLSRIFVDLRRREAARLDGARSRRTRSGLSRRSCLV